MDIFHELDEMRPFVTRRDWGGLEERFATACRKAAGEEALARIAGISLAAYQVALESGLARAISEAKDRGARAVYFEYDLDNDWQSGFFICPVYLAESSGEEDWACDFSSHFDGPDMKEFSAIYHERGFDRTPAAIGCTTFLVARTLAAFGRASERVPRDATALCAAFHDQTPIVRIYEKAEQARPDNAG